MLKKKAIRAAAAVVLSSAIMGAGTTVSHAKCINGFMTGFDDYERGARNSKNTFRVNELLVLCFTAAENGYVAVFDAPIKGDFEQLYPNELTHKNGETYAEVVAGKEYCFGGRDTFPLYHPPDEGIGLGKVSIALTKSPDLQLPEDDYDIPGQRVRQSVMNRHLRSHRQSSSRCTARDVLYLEYRITN
ncbi:DUF4384 domain-containing protein [Nitratireductor sp. XY-223]|uniref:DUF4384 domain-containing protein n=1 Tax=Nitratireductor sp. XY-223 TaxID=2561926 RepID=UPI0010AACC37|nr:DUF4384 domain-containing protein [Nitratireductor sp. XY-223]